MGTKFFTSQNDTHNIHPGFVFKTIESVNVVPIFLVNVKIGELFSYIEKLPRNIYLNRCYDITYDIKLYYLSK